MFLFIEDEVVDYVWKMFEYVVNYLLCLYSLCNLRSLVYIYLRRILNNVLK